MTPSQNLLCGRCQRFGQSKQGCCVEGVTDLACPNKAVLWKVSQIWPFQTRLFSGRSHRFGESKKSCFWEGVADLASPKKVVFGKVSQIWRVQKIRDFKLWLLAYFVTLFNCAKFQKDRTTFILHISKGSPLGFFFFVFVNCQKFKGRLFYF